MQFAVACRVLWTATVLRSFTIYASCVDAAQAQLQAVRSRREARQQQQQQRQQQQGPPCAAAPPGSAASSMPPLGNASDELPC